MSLFDKGQSVVDGLTGHKSKHYTAAETDEYARDKERGMERVRAAESIDPNSVYGDHGDNDIYQSFLNSTGAKKGPAIQKDMAPDEKVAMARAAMKRIAMMSQMESSINSLAEKTRMGGQFSDAGLMQADKEATLNANDRMRMKGMVAAQRPMQHGLGGSFRRLQMPMGGQ